MAISINWPTGVITVPQSFLTFISAGLYELDVDLFRLALKDLEDSEEGNVWPDTHRHVTESLLSGVTYARQVEILSPYTVTFQDTGSSYTVRCIGANHNIADVKNVNQVSLIIGNSAGMVVSSSGGGGLSSTQVRDAVWNADKDGLATPNSIGEHVADKLLTTTKKLALD